MAKQTITIRIDDRDVKELQRAIFRIQKEAKDELKDEVMDIARYAATQFQRSAQTTRQRLIAQSIKARRDVTPVIEIGGNRRMNVRGGATYSDMLFGVEFGAVNGFLRNKGRAFPYRTPDNRGYWIFPTARKIQPEITRRWYQAVDDMLDRWTN